MAGRTGRRGRNVAVVAALGAVLLVAGLIAVQVRRDRERERDDASRAAVEALVQAWRAGDLTGADSLADPDAAQQLYREVTSGLGSGVPAQVDITGVERDGDAATADLSVTWPLGGWTYDTAVPLTADLDAGDGGGWTADFTPAVVHPDLQAGDRLVASRTAASRGDILGRDGAPIVTASPVVEVGVQPSRTSDAGGLAASLADLLDVDATALEQRITAAGPQEFVAVVTLRRSDYDTLRARLQPLPGTVFRESTLPLAPTREFARALLGTVGPVTAELVEASDGRLVAGDVTGLSGLQRQYDERLAGTAGVLVEQVRGEQRSPLHTVEPVDGEAVQVTLDATVQQAADAALTTATGGNGNAALVAVDVPSGTVVAVADTPVSGADRALTGRYPPGSTFKTISTLALLGTGLTPQQSVPCPPTTTVDGRSFRNFEGGAFGPVPFTTDFAQSCNTAFVALSDRLSPGDLSAAAASVGLGVPWDVGVEGAYPGEVPSEEGDVELAEATIGQGRVLASPLAMAQAVSAVARGRWLPPSLVTEPPPAQDAAVDAAVDAPAADPAALATVRDLMRQVVVDGTAGALADVPGPAVHAKTGTAEYGTAVPPATHAWTVGFRGELAFAVLVEDGVSGAEAAVPVVEAFLRSLE